MVSRVNPMNLQKSRNVRFSGSGSLLNYDVALASDVIAASKARN